MIRIDDLRFEADLAKIIFDLKTNKNKSLVLQNYDSFILLNDIILDNYGVNTELDLTKIEKLSDKEYNKAKHDLVNYLDKSSKIISKISNNFVNKMDEINFSFIQKNNTRIYSEEEFKDIILCYFNTYGDDIYKIANSYFKEQRIGLGYKLNIFVSAYYLGFPSINSGYIFCKNTELNSLAASNIVHEIGHAIDAHKFFFKNNKFYSFTADCLVESVSCTYEYGFCNFLKEQNIDIDGFNILNNDMIDDMKIRMQSIKEFFKECKGKVKTNDPIMDTKKVDDCNDAFYYGLSFYMALHLNYINSKDKKEYLDSLNKLITLRHNITLEELINKMGFSVDDFVSGKYIYPKIEKDYIELKKRYKF